MKRFLCLDYGHRRIGVAVSDPLGITAQPVDTIPVDDPEKVFDAIAAIAAEREVGKIVVGLPLNMDGSEGDTAAEVRAFAAQLEVRVGVEIVFWDERLSTQAVNRAMMEDNMRRRRRRARKDVMAAVIILQTYLDFLSR
ncbi:MAG TPA: Holliday junction resolvase RuvX [bacterium]|nr:Holliday junction resolvase RuvX [bacterium]